MSELGVDMLAHTYFANASSALAVRKGRPPGEKMIGLISRLGNEAEVTPAAIRNMVADAVPDAGDAEVLERSFERLIESN